MTHRLKHHLSQSEISQVLEVQPPRQFRPVEHRLGWVIQTVADPVFIVIGCFFLLRLVIAAILPLSIDESYAVVVSRSHSLSYFDHPPLGFSLARWMADFTGSEHRLIVRLPYVLMTTFSAWLLFDITRSAFGRAAGFWALASFSVAPFFLLSTGVFVVPDGPLNFFLLLSVWIILPIFLKDHTHNATLRWALSGFALGLALLCKYQGLVFALTAFMILISTPKGRLSLLDPGPGLAGIIAAICFIPVLVWNAGNGWESFTFQFSRAGSADGVFIHLDNFATVIAGQLVYVLPGTFVVTLIMLKNSFLRPDTSAHTFFAWLAAVPIMIFVTVALISKNSLPHWSMSGFLFALPLVGDWCARQLGRIKSLIRVGFVVSASAVPAVLLAVSIHAQNGFLVRSFYEKAPEADLGWPLLGWSVLPPFVQKEADGEGIFIVSVNWTQAAKIGYALGPDYPVSVLSMDKRHFSYMDDAQVNDQGRGLAMAALPADRRDNYTSEFLSMVSIEYVVTDEIQILTQDRAGFASFDIVAVPIRRR